ncbi:MAG: flagellar protein FlaG [Pseudomonadota bacterium]
MNISMSANVVRTQVTTEAKDVKRSPMSEPVEAASAAVSAEQSPIEKTDSLTGMQAAQQPKEEDLKNAVLKLNEAVQSMQRNLEFAVDETTGRTVVKVIDKETSEVIRQIPSEEAMKLAQYMHERREEYGSGLGLMQEIKA